MALSKQNMYSAYVIVLTMLREKLHVFVARITAP